MMAVVVAVRCIDVGWMDSLRSFWRERRLLFSSLVTSVLRRLSRNAAHPTSRARRQPLRGPSSSVISSCAPRLHDDGDEDCANGFER